MNDVFSAFYEEWRWAFWIAGLAIGQFLNMRRSASIRRQLQTTQKELAQEQIKLAQEQEKLAQERKLRKERDRERDYAYSMIAGLV